jgi:hypothetical protein
MPRIRHFIRSLESDVSPIPKADLEVTPDFSPEKYSKKSHFDVVFGA